MTGEQNVPMRVEDEIDAALKMLGETQASGGDRLSRPSSA